ncbi:Methyltransferase-like protein 7A [Orchesella cincta]|uniref:Methyltransferase-like protein 7A n=1 Tax=Orchesella cincta TaxID=48709 RepID=A0A1D2MSI8_ORCCI|nr:Methyltransferase-like protein 7A [Orchesella cincta]
MYLEIIGLSLLLLVLWVYLEYGTRYIGKENRHRHFAEFFKHFHILYNEKTGPLKKKLFQPLHKLESNFPDLKKNKGIRVLEIGAGSGANMEFYPENTKLIVVDPNPFFRQHLESNLRKFPGVELERCVVTGAEYMKDIPDHSVDAVVSTLVLCSAPDLEGAYKEIQRVLVPGGKFYFMEHILDPSTSFLKLIQIILGSLGIWQLLFDGCRLDKNIKKTLEKGGFAQVDVTNFRLNLDGGVPLAYSVLYLAKPHIYGTATTTTT